MNVSHARVTDWGLSHVSIAPDDVVLDVGCGGGRTIEKLAAMATRGRVYGIDHSSQSVAASRKRNAREVGSGRVDIQVASVSDLPFADATFDVVTAVETHIWWPDLPRDVQEVRRVLKPGGRFVVISEVYRGAEAVVSRLAARHADRTGMTLLDVDQHQRLLAEAGYTDIEIDVVSTKGWICVIGRRSTTR
jgi:ubiquinone/menaquinone biosynthesis C-methylase UbiE